MISDIPPYALPCKPDCEFLQLACSFGPLEREFSRPTAVDASCICSSIWVVAEELNYKVTILRIYIYIYILVNNMVSGLCF